MMKLYYSKQSRATRPRWVMEELGLEYEIVPMNLQAGDQRKPEFKELNPLGQIPVLQDHERVICESGAICLYLADRYRPGTMAPALDQRGDYYRFCFYVYNTLEHQLIEIFLHTRFLPEDQRKPERVAQAKELLQARLQIIADHLATREFIADGRFTTADVLVGSALDWAHMQGLLGGFPSLVGYVEKLKKRPAYQRAHETEVAHS
ncbi:glutathione S-transferase family protein [bacterium]|nr:glutathione S-transferase family protein [bacterium]